MYRFRKSIRAVLLLGGVAALILASCGQPPYSVEVKRKSDRPSAPPQSAQPLRQPVTHTDNIVNGEISVGPGSHHRYAVTVTPGMENARLTGRFTASGGSGNDICVYVLDNDSYVNWSNGHSVSTHYSSGQITTGSVNVNLSRPGTYYLVYSNTFSTFSSKSVSTRVDLQYEQ